METPDMTDAILHFPHYSVGGYAVSGQRGLASFK